MAEPYGLQHHFDSYEQQQEASYLGMWLFLVTEILFFGGAFTVYIVYRTANYEAFAAASNMLDLRWGAINTAVLIGSSLTMALAVWAAQTGKRKATVGFLLTTLVWARPSSASRRSSTRTSSTSTSSPARTSAGKARWRMGRRCSSICTSY